MRWMVVALLLANIVTFGWYRYASPVSGGKVSAAVALRSQGEALQLLGGEADNAGAAANDSVGEASMPVAPAAPTPAADAMCSMIGAFSEQISARQVRDRLRALSVAADIVEVPVTLRTDYWVHMGPYPSRERAMVALRELQQKGVDSFLIADGELENGISLGLFRQKASADALLKQRRAQGYAAAVREMPRTANELWVVIKEGSDLADSVRRQLLAVSPGTEYRKNRCDAIVTANKFE